MHTGTIFSGIGHAGLILWVLVGDWLFPARPTEDVIITSVSMMTSAEFDALQAAATSKPAEETAPVKPQPRPEKVTPPEEVVPEEPAPEEPAPEPPPVEEPPVEEVVPVEPPNDLPLAEEEQLLPSVSTEENALPEAEEIVAPQPVEVETEAETSDNPTPAVAEDAAAEEVIEDQPSVETVPEDTGDVVETEANEEQDDPTGMTASPRPKARPEKEPEPEPEPVAEETAPEEPAEEPTEEEQPVDDQATEDAIAELLGEAVEEPVEEPAETGGQDLPQGPPLTGGEMGNIASAIGRRWNLGASSTDALNTRVVVRVTFDESGKPIDFELLESDGPTQTAIDHIFRNARSAVTRAFVEDGGLPLPPDKYDTWRVLDLVFDANGMRQR